MALTLELLAHCMLDQGWEFRATEPLRAESMLGDYTWEHHVQACALVGPTGLIAWVGPFKRGLGCEGPTTILDILRCLRNDLSTLESYDGDFASYYRDMDWDYRDADFQWREFLRTRDMLRMHYLPINIPKELGTGLDIDEMMIWEWLTHGAMEDC